jgi:hypothetical protein
MNAAHIRKPLKTDPRAVLRTRVDAKCEGALRKRGDQQV